MTRMYERRALLMSGLFHVLQIIRRRISRVMDIALLRLEICLPLSKAPRKSARRLLLFLLFSWVWFGSLFGLFFHGVFSAEAIESSATVQAVGISASQVTTAHGNASKVGTGVHVPAQGSDNTIFDVAPTVNAGDVIGVSIIQLYDNTSFGVSNNVNSSGQYPYSAFLYRDGSTFYFKCFSKTCHTGWLATLKHDATYIVSVYKIGNNPDSQTLLNMQGYLNSINEFIKVAVNQQVNINDSISQVGGKIEGVWKWLESIQNNNNNNSAIIQQKLDTITDTLKNSDSEKVASQELKDREKLESDAEEGIDAQENQEYKNNSENLIQSLKTLADTPATDCRLQDDNSRLPLSLDFCDTPRPAFIIPLVAIPSAIAGIFLSIRIIKRIYAHLESFRQGVG